MSTTAAIEVVDNVFVKMMHMYLPGDKIHGHAHTFDHITLLATGRVVMRAKGQEHEHEAPKLIVTPKGVVHEFEALAPNCLLCCIHAIRNGDNNEDIAPQNITEQEAIELMNQFSLIKS